MADNDHNTRWPAPSVTSVPEYQLSGLPYCETKSVNNGVEGEFNFPRVTRWIVITSNQTTRVFFKTALDGDNAQYFDLPKDSVSPRLEVRCANLYVKPTTGNASISVIAGLTHIDKTKSVPETMLDWKP